ncbi:DUF3307 domain-containing protein [bacterium]|nr:DUF3307 domain-containing protein [bacterium]
MIPGDPILRTLAPAEVLLALLIVGHVLADFLVQTEAVATRKGRAAPVLALHGLLTLATHALLLLPFWSPALIAPLLVLGAYHLALDAIKGRLERGDRRGGLGALLLDQGLHLLGLVAVWLWMRGAGVLAAPPVVPVAWLSPIAVWGVIVAGLVLNGKGGTAVVRSLLRRYPTLVPAPQGDPTLPRVEGLPSRDDYEMGRTIGVLERLIVYLLVLAGQWAALGLVLAAKSIARFPELKNQRFADYYLMGTLASMLTAIAVGMLVVLAVFRAPLAG